MIKSANTGGKGEMKKVVDDTKEELRIRIGKLTECINSGNEDSKNKAMWRYRRNELLSMLTFIECREKHHERYSNGT